MRVEDKLKQADVELQQAQREHAFLTQVLMCRDKLLPIISGEITRGHCVGGRECYGAKPGRRKTTLKDAVTIAKAVHFLLNRAVDDFEKDY
jgi:hypothetical protein